MKIPNSSLLMNPYIISIYLVFSLSFGESGAIEIEGFTSCSTEADQNCLDEKRLCAMSEYGREECGPCISGYIDAIGESGSVAGMTPSCVEIAEILWRRFVTVYDPLYSSNGEYTNEGEVTPVQRLLLFKESAQFISEHNALNQGSGYTLGLTPFSADTEPEYLQRSGYFYVNIAGTGDELPAYDPPTVAAADFPKSIDWAAAGAVTPIKDQGRCGCSWATSVCGAIEGAAFVTDRFNESLSFQQLISCNERNLGCDGGSMTIAAIYTAENWFGGVTTLNDYRFNDADGLTSQFCNLTTTTPPLAVEVTDPIIVGGLSKTMNFDKRLEMFKLALVEKPIAMIMKSSCKTFSNFISGILTDDGDCACSYSACFDHSVLMVGYDDTGDIPYFKLKNSWGTRWGEDGYFRVAQIEKGEFGLFGIFGEGVMVDAQQSTSTEAKVGEVVEDPSFPIWAIVVIVILCSLCFCCCIFVAWDFLRRSRGEEAVAE